MDARLRTGGRVADVGSGSGAVMVTLAEHYPHSQFHGYELASTMLARAEANRAKSDVTNATFHDAAVDPLPEDGSFDLIITFDCLHDMTHPLEAARSVRAALRPDGVWFVAEFGGAETFVENLRTNPRAAAGYANSIRMCLAASMAEPDAEGFGSLGLPERKVRALAESAGFSQFRRLEGIDPGFHGNAYYEVRV